MTVERFLLFWSSYNTLIIEVLIGLILLTVLYLAFRVFFGAEPEAAGAALSTGELEKTLQKILENQAVPAATGAASAAELETLRSQIALKEQEIEDLKSRPAAEGAAAPVDSGAMDAVNAEKKKLEDKVKDLEARLAEYEIISEDIADLSFYKEENSKLQKEIDALKAGGAAAPAAAIPAEPVLATEPAVAAPEPAAPAAEIAPDPFAEMAAAAAAQPVAEAVPAAAPTPEPASEPMPDSIDAILAQNPLPTEAPAEPPAAETPAPAAENPPDAAAAEAKPVEATDDGQLMNQFADFVKKG